ncbi:teneurin-3 [Ictalurus furcatus]|uniref:teneurin-3 n=1 Tax=Ictalurus furcatus TaxID=66913 RepID=UPI00234FF96F|nr:teneurin-3 [Ictalurus furcatus]XP_053487997.1 teneurin-3 [Ictalurus furcatus]
MEVNDRRLHSSLRERMERGRGGERAEEEEDGGMERLGRKVYSSSDTLKAFENHHVVDINSGEMLSKHTAAQSLSLHQLGICSAAPRRGLSFCAETGLDHRVQNAGGVSISPDCAIHLWDRGVKAHGRESRMSSQSNSALTLTDTENGGKAEHDGGE